MSIQQAIDNKPLIQQIVTNLLAGKSSDNIFEQTGYISTDLNLPARNFIQTLLFVWFNRNGHYCNWQFRQSFLSNMSLSTSLDTFLKSFALIVGSNPQPYTFDWNYYSSPTYRELISGLTSRIIELEHFKQQNQLVDNTIVEHELTKLYSEVNPDPVQVANAHDFVKQIDQVYDTIKSKLI